MDLYQPLDGKSFEFRLLKLLPSFADYEHFRIECQLEHFSLLDPPHQSHDHEQGRPEYVALSYCWGDPEATLPIWVNGREVQVTTNLENAIRELRCRGHRWLWIDAICINQVDLAEKGAQIRRMGRIYALADAVVAWIGIESESSSAAIEAVLNIAPQLAHVKYTFDGNQIFEQKQSGSGLETLLQRHTGSNNIPRLFERPYWRRKWIIQEISKARHVHVICGKAELLPLEVLITFALATVQEGFATLETREVLMSLQHFRLAERPTARARPRPCLSEALIWSRHSKAKDARDHVFSVLDLAHDGNDLVPTPNYYQTSNHLFRELSWNMIVLQGQTPLMLLARGLIAEPNPIEYPRPGDSLSLEVETNLPSWSPCWSSLPSKIPPWIQVEISNAQQSSRPVTSTMSMAASGKVSNKLTVQGIAVERVSAIAGSKHVDFDPHPIPRWSNQYLNDSGPENQTIETLHKGWSAKDVLAYLWDNLVVCDHVRPKPRLQRPLSPDEKAYTLCYLVEKTVTNDSNPLLSLSWPVICELMFCKKNIAEWMELYIADQIAPDLQEIIPTNTGCNDEAQPHRNGNTLMDSIHERAEHDQSVQSTLAAVRASIDRIAELRLSESTSDQIHIDSDAAHGNKAAAERNGFITLGETNKNHSNLLPEVLDDASEVLENSLRAMREHNMRLIVTNWGHIRVAHEATRVGDIICQLEHCELPVVFRRAKQRPSARGPLVQLVGECCVIPSDVSLWQWRPHDRWIRELHIV